LLYAVLSATDTHAGEDKGHRSRPALERGGITGVSSARLRFYQVESTDPEVRTETYAPTPVGGLCDVTLEVTLAPGSGRRPTQGHWTCGCKRRGPGHAAEVNHHDVAIPLTGGGWEVRTSAAGVVPGVWEEAGSAPGSVNGTREPVVYRYRK